MPGEEFEKQYFNYSRSDPHQVGGPEFDILDALFADVDDFTSDHRLRSASNGIDEAELRRRASVVYQRLFGNT